MIEQHKQELNNVAKAIDALAARFEEIDRKYEQRLLAFAQPLFFDNRDDMERRMDELTPLYSETHDPKVKTELEELSWKLTEMLKRHRRRLSGHSLPGSLISNGSIRKTAGPVACFRLMSSIFSGHCYAWWLQFLTHFQQKPLYLRAPERLFLYGRFAARADIDC